MAILARFIISYDGQKYVHSSGFSVTQILREINFGENLQILKLPFFHSRGEFSIFSKFKPLKSAQISLKSKFRASKCVQMADFEFLGLSTLISRKI